MSDENSNDSGQNAGGGDDRLKNLQSEFDRKLGNLTEQLASQNQAFQQQMQAMVDAMTSSRELVKSEPEADDFLDLNPKDFKQQVLAEAKKAQAEALASQNALNQAVYQLSQEYPELQQPGEFQKAVIDIEKSLPASLRETPEGYELAVERAAKKLKIQPKSARQAVANDDFSMGSGEVKGKKKPKSEVSDDMLAIAQLMGRDIEDEGFKKRLEAAAKRKTWGKYE